MKKMEYMVEIEQSSFDIISHDDQDEDEIPNPLSQRCPYCVRVVQRTLSAFLSSESQS